MIAVILQETFRQFSLRTLYLEMLWFMTFGYMMHIFVVMILTKLSFVTLVKSIARLQLAAVLTSYLVAPVCAACSILLSKTFSVNYTLWFLGQQVYIWFTVCMMFFSAFLLCQVFVTVSCHRFRMWLIGVNAGVGILGFFVLKAMNLLVKI